MLSVVQEFLKATSPASVEEVPLLMNLVSNQHSPLLAAQQYLGGLLVGRENKRLQVLYKSLDCDSVEAFDEQSSDKFSGQVRTLQRMVLLASSWVQVRHFDKLQQAPFSLVTLADARAHENDRRAVKVHWDSTPSCCLRPGMARGLKLRGVDAEALQSPEKLG